MLFEHTTLCAKGTSGGELYHESQDLDGKFSRGSSGHSDRYVIACAKLPAWIGSGTIDTTRLQSTLS